MGGSAAALREGLGREIKAIVMPPDALEAALAAGTLALDPKIEKHYAASVLQNVRQISDGRMAHVGTVTENAAFDDALREQKRDLKDRAPSQAK